MQSFNYVFQKRIKKNQELPYEILGRQSLQQRKMKVKSTKIGNSLVLVAVSRFQQDVNYNVPVSKGKQPSDAAR